MNTEDLFEIKQKFLRTIPHPKLILKQILRLKSEFEVEELTLTDSSLVEVLTDYIDQEMRLKLGIANAQDAESLSSLLISLMNLHNSLIAKLASYSTSDLIIPSTIKMSDPFDAYALLKSLKALDLNETEIKQYLCTAQDASTDKMNTELYIAVVRAKKIEDHGR